MSALYLLIGISITVAAGFLVAFLRSAKRGQFDDGYTPAVRILFDEPPVKHPKTPQAGNTKKTTQQ